jgi:hypothetical protein
METSEAEQDDWISRWAKDPEYESRLRVALETKYGRNLLSWLKQNQIPLDGLAFAFFELVCDLQSLKEGTQGMDLPKKKILQKGVRVCRQTARWLRDHALDLDIHSFKTPPGVEPFTVIETPPGVESTCQTLVEYADKLEKGEFNFGTPSGVIPPGFLKLCRSDFEQIQVIAFLRPYFVFEGDRVRGLNARREVWCPITDFLIMAGLAPPGRTQQRTSTLWSNAWRGRKRSDQIAFMGDMLMSFYRIKTEIDGQPWRENLSRTVHETLQKYLAKDER